MDISNSDDTPLLPDTSCPQPKVDDEIEKYAQEETKVMFITDKDARYQAGIRLVEEIINDSNINSRIHTKEDAGKVLNQIDKRAIQIFDCHMME